MWTPENNINNGLLSTSIPPGTIVRRSRSWRCWCRWGSRRCRGRGRTSCSSRRPWCSAPPGPSSPCSRWRSTAPPASISWRCFQYENCPTCIFQLSNCQIFNFLICRIDTFYILSDFETWLFRFSTLSLVRLAKLFTSLSKKYLKCFKNISIFCGWPSCLSPC